MPAIELDMLLAYINKEDRLHRVASRIFASIYEGKLEHAYVASSAYMEFELVSKSMRVPTVQVARELHAFQFFPNLQEHVLSLSIILKASSLRGVYDMTFFDSLHAATALANDASIISVDKAYDDVGGLTRIEPSSL